MKSATAADTVPLTWGQVAAFRLARHHLSSPLPRSSLPRVAGDMAGAQSQVMSAAQLALRARTRGLRPEDVERALWRDRSLAKVWCMRGTTHLVPSEDFAVFVRGCAGRMARATDWMVRARFPIESINRVVEAMGQVLDRPLTVKELAARLSGLLKVKAKSRKVYGWGTPKAVAGLQVGGRVLSVRGLVYLACMRGVACAGPPEGNETTFVRPEAWLPQWDDPPVERAEDELLRRYLHAHGPATVRDFALWTYVTASHARGIWDRMGPELAPVDLEGRPSWSLRSDLSQLQRAMISKPVVRLLPSFDAFLLGHKDKGHLVGSAHYKRVYRPAGWLAPALLVDGRVAGVWSYRRKGERISLRVEPFGSLSREVRDGIETEAEDVGRFFDARPDLSFGRVTPGRG